MTIFEVLRYFILLSSHISFFLSSFSSSFKVTHSFFPIFSMALESVTLQNNSATRITDCAHKALSRAVKLGQIFYSDSNTDHLLTLKDLCHIQVEQPCQTPNHFFYFVLPALVLSVSGLTSQKKLSQTERGVVKGEELCASYEDDCPLNNLSFYRPCLPTVRFYSLNR